MQVGMEDKRMEGRQEDKNEREKIGKLNKNLRIKNGHEKGRENKESKEIKELK